MPIKRTKLPAAIFRTGIRACPFCGLVLDRAVPACERCHGSFDTFNKTIKGSPPPLETIMDLAGILKGDQNRKIIEKRISLSEKQFPQLKFLVCSLVCPEGMSAKITAWWMLNCGLHSANPSWTGLLLIDPKNRILTFQAGYDLEVFLNRQKLEQILAECSRWFRRDDWSQGVVEFFKGLHESLKQSHREANFIKKKSLKKRRRK